MRYYDIEELRDGLTIEEVKKIKRKLSIKYHPDNGGSVEMFNKCMKACDDYIRNLKSPNSAKVIASAYMVLRHKSLFNIIK